ncbi:unnamed protein product [Cuscuta epithymum]|uniref:Uncharacterized protein n=1 Tax=Cuscuta epithymum TaxID=186058 RepID=A0AAV0GBV5_9ASTE|nr:unnamed protein product [Cuscuta epithymum]
MARIGCPWTCFSLKMEDYRSPASSNSSPISSSQTDSRASPRQNLDHKDILLLLKNN